MRFTSKTFEIIAITATVTYVYTLNYCFFYGITPFRHLNAGDKALNSVYMPYGEQNRSGL